eukprot:gene6199-8646_t
MPPHIQPALPAASSQQQPSPRCGGVTAEDVAGDWVAFGGQGSEKEVTVQAGSLAFAWREVDGAGFGVSHLTLAANGNVSRGGVALQGAAYAVGEGLAALQWADGERWQRRTASPPPPRAPVAAQGSIVGGVAAFDVVIAACGGAAASAPAPQRRRRAAAE